MSLAPEALVLPATIVSVRVAAPWKTSARPRDGGVAAEGAVGQGGRAAIIEHAASAESAELPLKVQSVRVAVP